MKAKRDGPWDTNQHIVTYFSRVEQAVKRLKEGKVTTSEVKILSNVLFQIKQSGEMEWALKEWNKKPEADRTWKNAKTYFSKEYANRRKHAKIEAKQAGYGSANQAKEQREAEAEQEIAALTSEIAQQLKSQQNQEMARFMEQQKQMHEANQKLMQTLMQNILQTNHKSNQPQPNQGYFQQNDGTGEQKKQFNMRTGKQKRRAIAFKERDERGGGALNTMKAKGSTCTTSQRTMTSG